MWPRSWRRNTAPRWPLPGPRCRCCLLYTSFVDLQKPYCHFATQYNREIPNEEIDMDFMNLNQAAHGDREHGFIAARLRMPRKIIAGYWQDAEVQKRLGRWMRVAVGVAFSKELKVMRFGDNMREVAVTEGDKVGVQDVYKRQSQRLCVLL